MKITKSVQKYISERARFAATARWKKTSKKERSRIMSEVRRKGLGKP